MGCGCKSKNKKVTNSDGDKITEDKVGVFKKIVSSFLIICLSIILLPVIWVIIVVIIVKSNSGDGFDLAKSITKLMGKKEKPTTPEFEEEINPEDFELVDVDKVS